MSLCFKKGTECKQLMTMQLKKILKKLSLIAKTEAKKQWNLSKRVKKEYINNVIFNWVLKDCVFGDFKTLPGICCDSVTQHVVCTHSSELLWYNRGKCTWGEVWGKSSTSFQGETQDTPNSLAMSVTTCVKCCQPRKLVGLGTEGFRWALAT